LNSRLYPNLPDNWARCRFRDYLIGRLRPTDHVLDFGAGAGTTEWTDFRSHAERVCGVDVDPAVLANAHLHEAKLLEAPDFAIPYPNCTFDAVFSQYAIEHIREPVQALREIKRVLKPGGTFIGITPNALHYVTLTARYTPQSFHRFVQRLRTRGPEQAAFPTYYRMNTRRAMLRAAETVGLRVDDLLLLEGRPSYLTFCGPLFLLGCLYERAVNSSSALAGLRTVILFALSKSGQDADQPHRA